MDIQASPPPVNESKVSLRSRLFYASIERNRKWLPIWIKMMFLKMVRRKIGVENMTFLVATASKEPMAQARENLRRAGLL